MLCALLQYLVLLRRFVLLHLVLLLALQFPLFLLILVFDGDASYLGLGLIVLCKLNRHAILTPRL